MDDVKCPRCRSPLFHDAEETPGGYVAVHPVCSACNWEPITLYSEYPMGGAESAKADALATLEADLAPLAWFEPRDRLPTPAERRALTAKHGDRAGWMVRFKGNEVFEPIRGTFGWNEWGHCERLNAGLVETYPHVDGRPVGWPEVKP